MKILHVIPDLSPLTGGPVSAMKGLIAAQSALGHKVTLVSTDAGMSECAEEITGANTQLVRYQARAWKWSAGLSKCLSFFVPKNDIVHVHTLWEYPVFAAATACQRLNKPYVLRPCGMLDQWSLKQHALKKKAYFWLLGQSILDHARAIHFTSRSERSHSQYSGNEHKAIVIPLGVTMSDFDSPDENVFYQKFPELVGNRFILFLGRLHYKKRPDLAIRAFQKIGQEFENLYFLMAGPGEANELLKLKKIIDE